MPNFFNLLFFVYLLFSGQYGEYSTTLKLSFTGDIMAHNVNYLMEDYSLIYNDVKDIFLNDDLSFGNLEFPVVPDSPMTSYPSFNVHPSYVEAAVNAGLDVFSLANNHTFDKGLNGVIATYDAVTKIAENTDRDIYFSGTKTEPDEAFMPVTIIKKGYKIGFIAVTQFMNGPFNSSYVFLANYDNPEEAESVINLVAEQSKNYDLFIVSYHGDGEYSLKPDPGKVEFFHKILNAGADIVYGHHPHVPQPYEIVNVNGLNKVILYSTGNFISGQGYIIDPSLPYDYWAYTGDSVIFMLKTVFTAEGPSIVEVEPFLIANYTTERNDVVVEPLINLASKELPGLWAGFYKARYNILSEFMEQSKMYSVIENETSKAVTEAVPVKQPDDLLTE